MKAKKPATGIKMRKPSEKKEELAERVMKAAPGFTKAKK